MKKPASFFDLQPPIFGREKNNALGLWLLLQMSMLHRAEDLRAPVTVKFWGNSITVRGKGRVIALKIWFRSETGTGVAAFSSGKELRLRMIETGVSIGDSLFATTDLAAVYLLDLVSRPGLEGE